MKQLSQDRARHGQRLRRERGALAVSAAALILAHAACAQHGPEDVKPTATTAYHTPQSDTPQPEAPQPAPPR